MPQYHSLPCPTPRQHHRVQRRRIASPHRNHDHHLNLRPQDRLPLHPTPHSRLAPAAPTFLARPSPRRRTRRPLCQHRKSSLPQTCALFTPSPQRALTEAVNAVARKHHRIVYSTQALRQVAEQIDTLYWEASNGEDGIEDDVLRRGVDLKDPEYALNFRRTDRSLRTNQKHRAPARRTPLRRRRIARRISTVESPATSLCARAS